MLLTYVRFRLNVVFLVVAYQMVWSGKLAKNLDHGHVWRRQM